MRRHAFMSLFLFLLVAGSKISRRFKRQSIPSQHIRIHSIDSKVNMDRFINVASMDSRIQLIEKNVNGTFWSASSKMQFDAYDSFVNASFNSQYFHIDIAQCELLFGNSLESLLFMTTNRTSDGHSALTFSLYDNANMTLVEEGIEFQGINGRRIYVKSETWVRPVEKTISLGLSDENISGETAIELTIMAPVHMTSVRFIGAELLIKYGPNTVSIDPNFQKVIVYNDHYSYCLDTKSPGSLHVNFGNGVITLDGGSSDFHVVITPVDATVNSRLLSKTQVDRGDGPIFISGVPVYETGITVNSLLLTLQLNNNGMMRADATGSEILMKTSIQNVGLTTEHQEIRITGGVPGLVIESGDVRFEVTKLSNPMAFTFLPGFSLPEDRFENIGPYSDDSTIPPFVFPDPEHLNYTKLATDCKGNEINFNISNPLETSTGYHLVTFPTVGVPSEDSTTRLPSTDNDLITETTPSITLPTNPVTEATTNPDNWSTESSTVTTIESTMETTTEVTSTIPNDETSTQLPIETTTEAIDLSSTPSDSQESTTPEIETTTEEGSLSTLDPNLLTTTENPSTDNSNIGTTSEMLGTTEAPVEGSTTEVSTYSTDISTDNPSLLTTESLGETTTVDLQLTSEEPITTQETSTEGPTTSTEMDLETTQPTLPQEIFTEEPTTSEMDLETTQATVPQETSTEGETTTIIMTTETYPLPSQLSTDDFVIGHWFSTEEVKTETTTEPSEIGITVSLGNVDFVTTTEPEDGVPLPNDLNIGSEPSPSTANPLETTTLDIGNSIDGFPEPSFLPPTNPPPKAEKMLILKLQVPDDVDVNSSQFIRNITSSLRRLVRDVSTELKKRRKRSTENDTTLSDESSDVLSIPIKVENITKTRNITVVTFALQFDTEIRDGEYELENALHNVNTNDLHRYFAFEPIEKISIDRQEINEEKLREVLIASAVAFLLFLIAVFLYLKKKGVLEKVFRKFDRIRCNTLAARPSAFSPN